MLQGHVQVPGLISEISSQHHQSTPMVIKIHGGIVIALTPLMASTRCLIQGPNTPENSQSTFSTLGTLELGRHPAGG